MSQHQPARGHDHHDIPRKICVKNLHFNTQVVDLEHLFTPFGHIRDISLPRDYYSGKIRGLAFITFNDGVSAALAIAGVNGFFLLGRKLIVEFAIETNRRSMINNLDI